jgi:hypothetical protein
MTLLFALTHHFRCPLSLSKIITDRFNRLLCTGGLLFFTASALAGSSYEPAYLLDTSDKQANDNQTRHGTIFELINTPRLPMTALQYPLRYSLTAESDAANNEHGPGKNASFVQMTASFSGASSDMVFSGASNISGDISNNIAESRVAWSPSNGVAYWHYQSLIDTNIDTSAPGIPPAAAIPLPATLVGGLLAALSAVVVGYRSMRYRR